MAFKGLHYWACSSPASFIFPSLHIKEMSSYTRYLLHAFLTPVFAHASLSTGCILWLPHPHFQHPHGFILLVLHCSSMSSTRPSGVLPVGIISSSYKLPQNIIGVSYMAIFIFDVVWYLCMYMSYISPDFKHLNDASHVLSSLCHNST